jgi:hypothetical protein
MILDCCLAALAVLAVVLAVMVAWNYICGGAK